MRSKKGSGRRKSSCTTAAAELRVEEMELKNNILSYRFVKVFAGLCHSVTNYADI